MEYSAQRKSQILSNLSTSVPQLFNDAQKPNAVLLKLSVALRKIQEVAALKKAPKPEEPQDIDEEGEKAFNTEFIRNVNKILPIRRKEPHADSIVRFIATFLQYTQKQGTDTHLKK